MASEYPKTSNQGTVGARKHVTLMNHQKLEKIWRHKGKCRWQWLHTSDLQI
jgi:hypothetical protein